MNYYIDIEIQPDEEMRENVLLNKVYSKLHKALFDINATNIGVSFPEYKIMLGKVIRLHGSSDALAKLQTVNWLGGLIGYCKVTNALSIPNDCKYRVISRKRTTMSQSKLNRLIKRNSITELEIKQYKAKMFAQGLSNPYMELVSNSNGHKYRNYINFGELLEQPVNGAFDQFGLSKGATIPWF